MDTRFNPFGTDTMPKFVKHIIAASQVVDNSPLPTSTGHLVKIRASQINGCGPCLDMHTKEAANDGESTVRLNLVAAWRETTVFTDAERAALELTELGTRLADSTGVSDEAWARAAACFDEEQLAALVAEIAVINVFNRVNVITGQKGGTYQAGQAA